VIVGFCFAVGAAWPFLAGVKLVPDAPAPRVQSADDGEDTPAERPQAAPSAPAKTNTESVELEPALVLHCTDKQGKKHNECDKPVLGDMFHSRLKALAACDVAKNLSGKLSIGFKLDFKKNQIDDIVQGKSTTLDIPTAKALVACAEREFESATLSGVEHEFEQYLIFYMAEFVPPGTPIAADSKDKQSVTPASGTATVVFESAMIRETADEDSKLLTRLLYGTRVFVTGRLGDWYEIKYDAKGHQGWVHKNAIGMK
jgi:hypothetical protein